MKQLLTLIFFICISLIKCLGIASVGSINGILSRGNDWPADGRTSLVIPADGTLYMKDYLAIGFDVRICRDGDHFGYICTIQVGREEMSVMLINPTLCAISSDGTRVLLKRDGDLLPIYDFNHLSLNFQRDGDSIKVCENGEQLFSLHAPEGKLPVRIIFGKDSQYGRAHVDVAPMEIKDITISLDTDSDKYIFPLVKSANDTVVRDATGVISGRIANFDWLEDAHSRWKLIRTVTFDSKVYPISLPGSRYLYLIAGNQVVRVNLDRNRVWESRIDPAVDMSRLSNQFIVEQNGENSERIVFYNTAKADDYPILSVLDLEKGCWNPLPEVKKPMSRSNHAAFYREADSSIIEMFGYGYHRYYADMNIIKNDGAITCINQDSDGISPRYLGAMGSIDSTLLLWYGGIGNKYGEQEFGSKIFTDLYTIDVNTLMVTKLLDGNDEGNEIVARSLITDADSDAVLGLFYDPFKTGSYLTLKSLNIKTGETTALTDSIPYLFHDMTSSADLLHPRGSESLFAVTVHRNNDNGYVANIYSLRLPVLILDNVPHKANGPTAWLGIVMIFILLCIVITTVCTLYYRRHHRMITSDPIDPEAIREAVITLNEIKPEILNPGVYLLGGFRVIDSESEPITHQFTPLLRSLLSLLVVYTGKNETGISNASLKDALWMDKSEESFLNNRSVNVRKLRTLLTRVGNVSLEGNHGRWSIKVTEGSTPVDYFTAIGIMNDLKRKEQPEKEEVERLIEIANKGQLLPDMQAEWLDQFKASYTDGMIETLRHVLTSARETGDLENALKLASAILNFDSIDEDAMRAKCRLLMDDHRMGSAIKAFNHFTTEYKTLMGQDFPQSFNDFINNSDESSI